MKRRMTWTRLVVSVSIAALASACGSGAPSTTTPGATTGATSGPAATAAPKAAYHLTIGTDMSSQFTSACCSIPMANGFQAWIAHVNSEGGVNGHPIETTILDDRADVAVGLANYQQALDSNTLGVFIQGSSTVFTPIAERAIQDKIVETNVGGYKGGIGVYPYVYNILANLPMFVETIPSFAATQVSSVSGAKASYLTYQSTLTETFQPEITGALTAAGWDVFYNQLVPTTATDFAVAAGTIASGEPDVVIVDLLEGQLPQFVSQLRARNVEAPIVQFSANISDATKEKINDPKLYYLESTASPTDMSNPAIVEMNEIANATGFTTGLQNAFFINGFVHGQVVLAALAKCGDTCTRESLNTALETTTVPGGGLMAGEPGYSADSHVMTKKLIVDYWDAASKSVKTVDGYGL